MDFWPPTIPLPYVSSYRQSLQPSPILPSYKEDLLSYYFREYIPVWLNQQGTHETVESSESEEDTTEDEDELEYSTIRMNHLKGHLFEKQIDKILHDSNSCVQYHEAQVECQYGPHKRGYADFVFKSKSGKKWVIEAKNYDCHSVKKKDIMQVYRYAKCLKAKPCLVVSNTTLMPPDRATKKLAREKGVRICTYGKFKEMLH